MTRYVLENLDAQGNYLYKIIGRWDSGHPIIELTNVIAQAKSWEFMSMAIAEASTLSGRWRTVAVKA